MSLLHGRLVDPFVAGSKNRSMIVTARLLRRRLVGRNLTLGTGLSPSHLMVIYVVGLWTSRGTPFVKHLGADTFTTTNDYKWNLERNELASMIS